MSKKTIKVIPMIDDCGHGIAIDISTKTQETKVVKGLVQDVLDCVGEDLEVEGVSAAKKLLAKKVLLFHDQDLREFLGHYTQVHFGRDISPTVAYSEWPKGLVRERFY